MQPAYNLAVLQSCVRGRLEGQADGLHGLTEREWGGCLQEGNVVGERDFIKGDMWNNGADGNQSGLL